MICASFINMIFTINIFKNDPKNIFSRVLFLKISGRRSRDDILQYSIVRSSVCRRIGVNRNGVPELHNLTFDLRPSERSISMKGVPSGRDLANPQTQFNFQYKEHFFIKINILTIYSVKAQFPDIIPLKVIKMDITVIQAHKMINENTANPKFKIIDVRSEAEYSYYHIKGAKLIPLGQLGKHLPTFKKDETYLMVCRSGNRSGIATMQLRSQGFNAINMDGGIVSWTSSKFPTVK